MTQHPPPLPKPTPQETATFPHWKTWIFVAALVLSAILLFLLIRMNAPGGGNSSTGQAGKPIETKPSQSSSQKADSAITETESIELPTQPTIPSPAVESNSGHADAIEVQVEDTIDQLNVFSDGEEAMYLATGSDTSNSLAAISKPVRFYGIESSGSHVAFVVDKSSSMAGTSFAEARRQLIDSVKRMTSKQTFSIFFYDTASMSDARFIERRATKSAADDLASWVNQVNANGGTDPLPAIKEAFKRNYDLIFLVSDGEFYEADEITRANQRRASISTIAIGGDSATLKRVAEDNGGQYKMVD